MREERIVVHPFEQLKIESYQSVEEVNEHAYIKMSGQIPFKKKDEYMYKGESNPWVRVIAVANKKEHTLLYGIIENIRMEIKNKTCRMELVLRSGTVQMDCRERMRSFQSESLTYSEVLDICNQNYNADGIMSVAKGTAINRFIMQYQETDWNFIKRLASINQTVVIADSSARTSRYYFGLPDRENTIKGDNIEYDTCYDVQEYWLKKGKNLELSPVDTMIYVWTSREIYHLGDCGLVQNKQLIVWKIITEMKGGVLYHTYYMRTKSGFKIPVIYHTENSGASLFGVVRNVSEEKVQIEIFGDENRERTGARWFPYATVYSSEDGTGWYCMPEIRDKIRLYFPTEKEQDAYVISAYHEGNGGLRTNPQCKFWRNREGKEIQLAPGRILLTNNNGTYIELSDSNGVEIVSGGPVVLSAGGALRISSASSGIELSAPNKVKLKQGDTEMSLGGDLNMSGAQIKL